MSKRDQALDLFSKDKRPGDPELEVLGLKRESQKRYFRDWKKIGAELAVEVIPPEVVAVVPPVPLMVRASSLKSGDKFELNGDIYRVGKSRDCVIGANLSQPRASVITLNLNVMVKPVR